MNIVDVSPQNLTEAGFFCKMSQRKSAGYRRKLSWLQTRVVELKSAREVRERSPSPYGVFAIVLDGSVISHYYLPEKKLVQILDERTV